MTPLVPRDLRFEIEVRVDRVEGVDEARHGRLDFGAELFTDDEVGEALIAGYPGIWGGALSAGFPGIELALGVLSFEQTLLAKKAHLRIEGNVINDIPVPRGFATYS